MDKIANFGVYDQISYVFVGALAELVAFVDLWLIDGSTLPSASLPDLALLTFAAYFLGHLAQAVSNILFKEKQNRFNAQEKPILDDVIKKYRLNKNDYYRAFTLCTSEAKACDKTGEIVPFLANSGLYRGWKTIFAINAIFGFSVMLLSLITYSDAATSFFDYLFGIDLATAVSGRDFHAGLLVLSASAAAAYIFHKRVARFRGYIKTKVLVNHQLLETDRG